MTVVAGQHRRSMVGVSVGAAILALGVALIALSTVARGGLFATAPPAAAVRDPLGTLLSHLPDSVGRCSAGAVPVTALARIDCSARPGSGHASTQVVFLLYGTSSSSREAFATRVPSDVAASDRVCPDGPDRSDYRLEPGGPTVGLLACFIASGSDIPTIVWTSDESGILAVIAGPAGGSLADAWQVWLGTPIGPTKAAPAPAPDTNA